MKKLSIAALLLVLWLPTLARAQTYMGNGEFNNGGMTTLPNNQGSSGTGTVTCNWATSTTCEITATGNFTVAFSAPPNPAALYLIIKEDSTGNRTVTLPTLVLANGVTQTTDEISQQANSESILQLFYDGFNYVLVAAPMAANMCSGQGAATSSTLTVANKCFTAATNQVLCVDQTTAAPVKCLPGAGTMTITEGTGGGATDTLVWARIH